MKILLFIVLSTSLLFSQAFLTIPKSSVALAQDVEAPNKISQSIPLTLHLLPNHTDFTWAYYVDTFVGTPKEGETVPVSYKMMMSLNSVNTSLFTNACSINEDIVGQCGTIDPFAPENSKSFTNYTESIVMSPTNSSKVLGYMGTDNIGFSNSEEAKFKTDILFRVNATMEKNFTGLISLSPKKDSFLQVLKNNSQITEQQFMYTTDPASWFVKISGMKLGDIPEIYEKMPWFKISNDKWQIEANYVAIDGQKGQDCNAINWAGMAFFNEAPKILLPPKTYDMLLLQLESKKLNDTAGVRYNCAKDALKRYPNISIYTSQYKIDIPADAYLDFNNKNQNDYCPLAVGALSDTKSCITLGYYFFGYSQVVFSKDKQQIGLLKKDNVKELTVFPFENVTGIASLILLVVVFGFVFVKSSQKEEELRIDIDNTPRQVRSASYYEYSYVE